MKVIFGFWIGLLVGAWAEWRYWYRQGKVPKKDGTYWPTTKAE